MHKIKIILNLFDGGEGAAASAEDAENGSATGTESRSASEAQIRGRELGLSDDLLEDYERAFFGGDDAQDAGDGDNDETDEIDEENETGSAEDADAEFDELVKGKYKDAYKRHTQKLVSERLNRARREADELKNRAAESDKILSLLANKYGKGDTSDLNGLYEALKGDSDTWRQQALDSGRSVEELQSDYDASLKQAAVNAELEELRQYKAQAEMAKRFDGLVAKTRETYPGFDPQAEFDNPKFTAALDFIASQREAENKAKGTNDEIYDLTYAYELAHADELRSNGIKRAVKATSSAIAHNIQANRSRPQENAARRTSRSEPRDFFDMSDSDFDKLVEKIRNGEARI